MLQLLPAEPADIPRLTAVVFAAFEADALHVAMMPRADSHTFVGWYNERMERAFRKEKRRRRAGVARHVKVVDTEGGSGGGEVIVGYGRWYFPGEGEGDGGGKEGEEEDGDAEFPEHVNGRLIKDYLARVDQKQGATVDKTKDYVCSMLATHPSYQGKGAGSLMIRYGLDAADADDARAFLEATPRAYPLYLKYGWRDTEDPNIDIDLKAYGVVDGIVHRTICMVRGKTEQTCSRDGSLMCRP